jgi:WD40 repeat protein
LVIDASFSPDGRRVATASTDGSLRIWNVRSGRAAVKPVKVVAQDLLSVRYSRDGRRLVTGAADGVVRVYDARKPVLLAELKGHLGYVYDAAFAAGGTIVSGGEDGTLRIWAPVEATAMPANATDPRFSADGRHVVSGDEEGHVHVWTLATGSDRRLPGHGAGQQSVARESADGSRIVSAAADGTVRLYDVRSGRSRRVPAHTIPKSAIAIDRTGRRIAFGEGPLIQIRADGGGRRVLRGHTDEVYALDFSPDGTHLASASKDATARIFNVETGKLERTLRGHADAVLSVAYSDDGKRIVTAGTDGTIRIWPVDGGAPTVLYGHQGVVRTAAFNPRGDRIVSAGEDGTVRVWDAAGGVSLVVLQRHELANGADFSRDGRVVSEGVEGAASRGVLRVSACAVCGPFADVLRLARSRADRTLNAAERRLLAGGP